jgi:hypothetical protein
MEIGCCPIELRKHLAWAWGVGILLARIDFLLGYKVNIFSILLLAVVGVFWAATVWDRQ